MTNNRNVIVFGETGVGKSSIINMLTPVGERIEAEVSSGVIGQTFDSRSYRKKIRNLEYAVYDTVGLNEAAGGSNVKGTGAPDAIRKLYELMCNLTDGVNLLVFVTKGRITNATKDNYKMFFEHFCQKKVPIVLIVTGLESEKVKEGKGPYTKRWIATVDEWMAQNMERYQHSDMVFKNAIAITATKGAEMENGCVYERLYNASKTKVETLIALNCSEKPWRMSPSSWFVSVILGAQDFFSKIFNLEPMGIPRILYSALVEFGKVGKDKAKEMVRLAKY